MRNAEDVKEVVHMRRTHDGVTKIVTKTITQTFFQPRSSERVVDKAKIVEVEDVDALNAKNNAAKAAAGVAATSRLY